MNTDKTNEDPKANAADAKPTSEAPVEELKKVEPSVEVINVELETKELVVPRFFGVRGGVR